MVLCFIQCVKWDIYLLLCFIEGYLSMCYLLLNDINFCFMVYGNMFIYVLFF
jgi:hypothetical protein